MGRAKKLCCCSLTCGCISIGILELIAAFVYGIVIALHFAGVYSSRVNTIFLIVVILLYLLEGILLIVGANTKNVGLCYGWMACLLIEGILNLISAIMYFFVAVIIKDADVDEKNNETKDSVVLATALIGFGRLIVIAIQIYFFFVVLNFTYEVKEQRPFNIEGQSQGQGQYPSVGMQYGYDPRYNPHPSYQLQPVLYPRGQEQQQQPNQGIDPAQNFQTAPIQN